jgi:hypothetical protein
MSSKRVHATQHSKAGGDAVDPVNLSSGSATAGQVLEADGSGGFTYETGGGGGGSDNVLFKWNETDLTQFLGAGTPDQDTGLGMTMSVNSVPTADSAGRVTLEISMPVGFGSAFWAVDPTAITGAIPSRYSIRLRVELIRSTAPQIGAFLFAGDGGSGGGSINQGVGVTHYQNLDVWQPVRYDDGTHLSVAGTPGFLRVGANSNNDAGLLVEYDVNLLSGSPSEPYVQMRGTNNGSSVGANAPPNDFDWDGPVPGAEWNAFTPTTFGICGIRNGGSLTRLSNISDLILLKHPMDRT